MTTDDAKAYLLELPEYSEDDFQMASDEDIEMGLAKEGEWVCNFLIPYPVSEHEMKTAIELATDHKYWSNPNNVNEYIDFMMSN